MTQIEQMLDDFMRVFRESDVCKNYEEQKAKIKNYPEMRDKINEFRRRNFEIQTSVPQDRLLDEMDCFQKEYETFTEIPMVRDFLASELEYCRTLQEIIAFINDELMVTFE